MDITVETIEERRGVGLRTPVSIQEIGIKVGQLLPRVLAVAGPHADGAPVARWYPSDEGDWEMEVVVPVSASVEAQGDVKPTTLPGGRAVIAWHVGSYDGLAAAWGAFNAAIDAGGHTRRDAPWEEYTGDCSETPPEEVRTRLVFPIE